MSMPEVVTHYTHIHPLYKTNLPGIKYHCNGCNTPGCNIAYRCNLCDFDLHLICATCPSEFSTCMDYHVLTLVNEVGFGHRCDLCSGHIHGLFYVCRLCGFYVHPNCAMYPQHMKYHDHPHHLTLQRGMPSWCVACRNPCTTWQYKCNLCVDVSVHINCLFESFKLGNMNTDGSTSIYDGSTDVDSMNTYESTSNMNTDESVSIYDDNTDKDQTTGIYIDNMNTNESGSNKNKGNSTSGRRRFVKTVGKIAFAALLQSLFGVALDEAFDDN